MVFTLHFQEWLALCIQYAIQRQRVFVLRSATLPPMLLSCLHRCCASRRCVLASVFGALSSS